MPTRLPLLSVRLMIDPRSSALVKRRFAVPDPE
jgi:hypothetical protein